jgi:hypothetical protein
LIKENVMAKIRNAFSIIAEELPKFFTEMNVPFLGKDEERSVMQDKSPGQKEKEILETVLTAGASIIPAAKIIKSIPHAGKLLTGGAAVATGDPTMLLPGKLGIISELGRSGDAEAMVVPARFTHTADEISKALGSIRRGEMPEAVYEAGKKGDKIGGVYLGAKDAKIKSVISDEGVKLTGVKEGTLGEVLDHPELFKKIPELKDVNVRVLPPHKRESASGAYTPESNTLWYNPERGSEDILSTMLHETQHGIQEKFGFTKGSSPKNSVMQPEFNETFNNAVTERTSKNEPIPRNLYNDILLDIYRRGAGEAEARATQTMFENQDYLKYPLSQDVLDVPLEKLLIPSTQF